MPVWRCKAITSLLDSLECVWTACGRVARALHRRARISSSNLSPSVARLAACTRAAPASYLRDSARVPALSLPALECALCDCAVAVVRLISHVSCALAPLEC